MIGSLRGRLAARSPRGEAVVEVGGVGYRLSVSPPTLAALGDVGGEVLVHTHLHVREDALTLYGFATREERALFLQLLGVTGVGPKVALGVLSAAAADRLAGMIAEGDVTALARLPGIGRKTAQRVVLELKEKIAPLAAVATPGSAAADGHVVARDALVELGYSVAEAEERLAATDAELPAAERVRQALRAA